MWKSRINCLFVILLRFRITRIHVDFSGRYAHTVVKIRHNAEADLQPDDTDRALLALLTENARLPVTDLARRLSLARTTVQARIERLEAQGLIAGYTIRRGRALAPPLRATALVSVEARATPALLTRLRDMPEVEQVHTLSGRYDLMIRIAATDTERLDRILDRIGDAPGVRFSESLIQLSTKIDRAP
jgi:DNA-binding Lrp family transcriptional regulator